MSNDVKQTNNNKTNNNNKLMILYLYFMADYSIILLIKGGNLSGTNSYQSLVQSTFGFPGFLILSGLQFLYPFIGKFYHIMICSDLCVAMRKHFYSIYSVLFLL